MKKKKTYTTYVQIVMHYKYGQSCRCYDKHSFCFYWMVTSTLLDIWTLCFCWKQTSHFAWNYYKDWQGKLKPYIFNIIVLVLTLIFALNNFSRHTNLFPSNKAVYLRNLKEKQTYWYLGHAFLIFMRQLIGWECCLKSRGSNECLSFWRS